jgi:Uma2 family endonuclease
MSQGVERKPRAPGKVRRSAVRTVTVDLPSDVRLFVSPAGFWRLCRANPELRLERDANGRLVVMPPAATDSGHRNASITAQLWNWNERTKLGVVFDSSAGFTLPNTAIRGPDASWMARERWEALSDAERRRFSRICPDFVVELASPSDELTKLESKMEEYVAQGIRLGWLIDPRSGSVAIYRPGRPVERLSKPTTLSGEDVLPGFVLQLKGILYD